MEPVSATYQVFINHRGADVKKTLASLIYHRLTACYGLRVFLDEKELHTGDSLSPAILGAINSASVHIAIFTERYAESSWCLDELCSILRSYHERHTSIIPVFYDVQPSDLRHIESGLYAAVFEVHRRRGRDIEKWKTALNEASQIPGLLFKTNESDYGEHLERIVKDVLKEAFNWEPLEVTTHPVVGLEQAVEDFQNEIKKQSKVNDTVVVGITGMAGLGKSTLAKRFYNLKRSDFSRCCFLSEVRKSKDKLSVLQQKLFRDLLGYCDMHIDDTSQGKSIFRDHLRGLRVLIVLDDVDQIEQINSLLDIDAVGMGSLILITSRDKHLLRCSSTKSKMVSYEVKPLQGNHARELFCQHAFLQPKPYEGFEDLVSEFLKLWWLPLSLNILGAQLLGIPDRMSWKLQLEKLSRRLPNNIINKLKVSYEALNSEEKEIFLDIGCFFVGEDRDLAVQALEGLGYNDVCDCLKSLRQKCLVEYHEDIHSHYEFECRGEEHIRNCNDLYRRSPKERYKITMHDQVRELARHIAAEDFRGFAIHKPLRLGCSNDIQKMLQLQLKGGADYCRIRGIRKDQDLPADHTNINKGCRFTFLCGRSSNRFVVIFWFVGFGGRLSVATLAQYPLHVSS